MPETIEQVQGKTRRLRLWYIVPLCIFCILAVRATVNFSGMCSLERGWLSEQQLIDAGVAYVLAKHDRLAKEINDRLPRDFPIKDWKPGDPNPVYTYDTLEKFYQVNPDCCKIEYFWQSTPRHLLSIKNKIMSYVDSFIFEGVFGFRVNRVVINYKKYAIDNFLPRSTSVFVSYCGEAGDL